MKEKLPAWILQSTLWNKIQQGQQEDDYCSKVIDIHAGKVSDFYISNNAMLQFTGQLYVPDKENIQRDIQSESHTTPYSIHLGATKIFNMSIDKGRTSKANRNLSTVTYPRMELRKNHNGFCGEIIENN